MKLVRLAPVLKSLTVASAALIVACGGKTEAPAAPAPAADAAPAPAAADAAAPTPAPAADAAAPAAADAAAPAAADAAAPAPAADAGAAAAADATAPAPTGAPIDVSAFEKMIGFQEQMIGVIEANKTDLDKAAKEVTAWIETHKTELKATIAEIEKVGPQLQADPAQAMKLMQGFETKAKGLQERMEKLAAENPAIKDHEGLRNAMMAAMQP